jgi:hypothetical protein
MMRKLSTWLLGLVLAVLVSACCGNVSCECNDAFEDAIYFEFNLADSLGATGFRVADVDTVVLIRRPFEDPLLPPNAPVAPNDTARIFRSHASVAEPIILNNNAPFTAGGGRKLDAYKYQLYVVRRFKKPGEETNTLERITYSLDQFALAGKFVGDGCCTCYENRGKQLRVSPGTTFDRAGTIWNLTTQRGEQPKRVVLSRN